MDYVPFVNTVVCNAHPALDIYKHTGCLKGEFNILYILFPFFNQYLYQANIHTNILYLQLLVNCINVN